MAHVWTHHPNQASGSRPQMGKYKVKDWIEGPYDGKAKAEWEQEVVADYAESLASGSKSITDVIIELRPYVVETTDLTIAARAWSLLSQVFESRPLKLSKHDMTRLIEYTCQRIENKGDLYVYDSGMKEIASLLKAIAQNRHFIPGDASVMIKAIFNFAKSPRFQEHPESTRKLLLQIVESLIQTDSVALLRDSGEDDIVNGIVTLAAFEKRPGNLAIIFTLYSRIASSWSLNDEQYKMIWDSFMRYFPVSMKGAAGNQGAIAQKELADLMMQCMYSTPKFADETLRRMIEMLDESSDLSANTKSEVLRNLDGCIIGYPPPTIAEWRQKLWDSLKFEVWNGENEEHIKMVLKILKSIAGSLELLGNSLYDESSPLGHYIYDVSNDCRSRIVDTRTKYLSSSSMILHELGSFSPLASTVVSKSLLPSLFLLLQDNPTEGEKHGILTVTNEILKTRLESNYRERQNPEEMEKMEQIFLKYRGELFEVFYNAIKEVKTFQHLKDINKDSCPAILAIDGTCLLFDITGLLESSEKDKLVLELVNIALKFAYDNGLRIYVIEALKHISSKEPTKLEHMIVKHLVERLPTTLSLSEKHRKESMANVLKSLQDIVDISCQPCFPLPDKDFSHPPSFRNFSLAQDVFLTKLEDVMTRRGQIDYAVAILAAIYNGLASFDQGLTEQDIMSTLEFDSQNSPYLWIVNKLRKLALVKRPYPSDHNLAETSNTYTGLAMMLHNTPMEVERPVNEIELDRLLEFSPSDAERGVQTFFTHPGDSISDEFLNWVGKIIMCILESRTTTDDNNFVFNQTSDNGDPVFLSQTVDLRDGPPDKCQALIVEVYTLAGIKPVKGDDKRMTKTKEKLRINGKVGDMALAMIGSISDPKTPGGKKWRLVYGQYLQILIGKYFASGDRLSDKGYLSSHLTPTSIMQQVSNGSQELAYWAITYATTAALSSMDQKILPRLLSTLKESMSSDTLDTKTARTVATGFRLLLKDSFFLKEEHSVRIYSLRFSRLFNDVGLELMRLWEEKGNQLRSGVDTYATRTNILVALAGILHYQNPVEVLLSAPIDKLMPILLAGTDIKDDDWAKVTYLTLIKNVIPIDPVKFLPHVDPLLNRVTLCIKKTLTDPSDISTRGRVMALDIIGVLVKEVDNALHDRRKVLLIRLLDLAKDDVSYKVRNKAQYCRLEWMYET